MFGVLVGVGGEVVVAIRLSHIDAACSFNYCFSLLSCASFFVLFTIIIISSSIITGCNSKTIFFSLQRFSQCMLFIKISFRLPLCSLSSFIGPHLLADMMNIKANCLKPDWLDFKI